MTLALLRRGLVPVLVTLALIAVPYFTVPRVLEFQAVSMLKGMGFENPVIGNLRFTGPRVYFENVVLDGEGFSTIGIIEAPVSWAGLLLLKPIRSLSLHDVAITAEITDEEGFRIAGWQVAKLPVIPPSEITIDSAQIDIMTNYGAIRLEGKGHLAPSSDGNLKLNAAVWGIQHQLKADTRWEGFFKSPEEWGIEITLRDGRLNLDDEKISRVNGWASFEKSQDSSVTVSGQIDAGNFHLGAIALSKLNLTIEGTMPTHEVIASAEATHYEDMKLTADVRRELPDGDITLSIETPQLTDMMGFLNDLRASSDIHPGLSTFLMPFVLTQGNLERIRADVADTPHNMLELQLTGPLSDVTGKIIAKQMENGSTERRIISLDPGE